MIFRIISCWQFFPYSVWYWLNFFYSYLLPCCRLWQ